MTVGEARQTYSMQLREYNMQKFSLGKQKEALDAKIKSTENGSTIYANEAATLELTYNAVSDKQKEYQDYMNQLMEQWSNKFNEVATKQSAEAEAEGFKELGKIMAVVRRMIHGDNVPRGDEKKVAEYDNDLYQMAKNGQMMAQMNKKRIKNHKSLWEDEEKPEEKDDPNDVADAQEAFANGPEVVSVEDTVASATGGETEMAE